MYKLLKRKGDTWKKIGEYESTKDALLAGESLVCKVVNKVIPEGRDEFWFTDDKEEKVLSNFKGFITK